VKRKTLLVTGTILMLVALLPFLLRPIYKSLTFKKASPALIERTTKAVEAHPELKPEYDKAMEDGVLSYDEAKEILQKAGETVGPDE
jgi:hypothetical protein